MQTPSTITTTDSSTATEQNLYQTPVKKNPSGPSTTASHLFFTKVNQNIKPRTMEPKTEKELLDRIFSPENISNEKNLSYNNGHYLGESRSKPLRKRRFVAFEDRIDLMYPFLRYTTNKLKELLNDANDLNKTPSSKDEIIQPQREIPPHTINSEGSRTAPIDNLQTVIENSVQERVMSSTAQNRILLPRQTLCRQLFPGQPTADTQKSGSTPNELTTAPTQAYERSTPIKRKLSYLGNKIRSSSTSSSITELDFPSPFDDETRVFFRFVIGSTLAKQTLFSIGYDDTRMSHGQLAAKTEDAEVSCNAAGILCFEKSDGKWLIKTVSNKTGHFKCGSESFLTTIRMLFTDFSNYLGEEITLINESLENPKDKKSFTFAVDDLKERYKDCSMNATTAVSPVDISNTEENTAATEANSHLFFSTPKKSRPNVTSGSLHDNELVQLGTDDADQPSFEFD